MNEKLKPAGHETQPISGKIDERVRSNPPKGRGVDGPVEKDLQGYKTHYGETAYGGGQKRYGGQAPVEDVGRGDDARAEGKAGSKATTPGAGADHGPPDSQ